MIKARNRPAQQNPCRGILGREDMD